MFVIKFFDARGHSIHTPYTAKTRGEGKALAERLTTATGKHHFAEAVA